MPKLMRLIHILLPLVIWQIILPAPAYSQEDPPDISLGYEFGETIGNDGPVEYNLNISSDLDSLTYSILRETAALDLAMWGHQRGFFHLADREFVSIMDLATYALTLCAIVDSESGFCRMLGGRNVAILAGLVLLVGRALEHKQKLITSSLQNIHVARTSVDRLVEMEHVDLLIMDYGRFQERVREFHLKRVTDLY